MGAMEQHPPPDQIPAVTAQGCACAGQAERPVVLDAIRHPHMRHLSAELLTAAGGCWTLSTTRDDEMVADAVCRCDPAVVVVDSIDFPTCCRAALKSLPPQRVIVVGPEPDPAYRAAAVSMGAGGWVSRDRIAEDLSAAVRSALGCPYDQRPDRAERHAPHFLEQPGSDHAQ